MEFAKLRAFRAHVCTCLKLLLAYVLKCPHFLLVYMPKCVRADKCSAYCAHISRTYVPITTQDLETDIYPTDVKSDQN